MEQNHRKLQEEKTIHDLYNNISISDSFHDRALANLKRAEKEQDSMKKEKDKITYIEDIRKPKRDRRKVIAAGFVAAVLVTGAVVYLSIGGSNSKKAAAPNNLAPTPEQGKDITIDIDKNDYSNITPLPNQDTADNTEKVPTEDVTPLPDVANKKEQILNEEQDVIEEKALLEERVKNVKMMHLYITPSDGYEETELPIEDEDGKGTLAYSNGKDYEVYKVVETAENERGTNLVVTESHGESAKDLKEDRLIICCVDMEVGQNMDAIGIPLTNMTYKLINKDDKLYQVQYIDAEDTVRGTFTLDKDQWSMDDDAMIQMSAINVCNAYFSGDIDQVRGLVHTKEPIVCEENILKTMKPYLIKWDPEYVNREEVFGVSCQFYGPQDDDSYTYLSLEMRYENDGFFVTSMALEK